MVGFRGGARRPTGGPAANAAIIGSMGGALRGGPGSGGAGMICETGETLDRDECDSNFGRGGGGGTWVKAWPTGVWSLLPAVGGLEGIVPDGVGGRFAKGVGGREGIELDGVEGRFESGVGCVQGGVGGLCPSGDGGKLDGVVGREVGVGGLPASGVVGREIGVGGRPTSEDDENLSGVDGGVPSSNLSTLGNCRTLLGSHESLIS